MGQRPSNNCICAEDCQFQPWRHDPSVTTTLSALNKDGRKPGVEPLHSQRRDVGDGRKPVVEPLHSQKRDVGVVVPPPKGRVLRLGEVFRFVVCLSKAGSDSFGLAHVPIEDVTSCLLVVDFRDSGPVARWNKDRECLGTPEEKIRRGDRIVSVGSEKDIESMRVLLRQESVTFTVERWPEAIGVRLTKDHRSESFGVQTDLIERLDGVQALIVTGVTHGHLADWNSRAVDDRHYHAVVCPGCEVVCVNGVTSPAERLQQFLAVGTDLEILFRRPPPEAYQ